MCIPLIASNCLNFIGGIAAGFFSDLFQAQGMTCSVMFAIAAPLVSYNISCICSTCIINSNLTAMFAK